MDNIFNKTMFAGIFGTVAGGVGWLAGENFHNMLGNLLIIIGIFTALLSCIYMMKINIHRNKIKALEQAKEAIMLWREQMRFCIECREGRRPVRCYIPIDDRPSDCPLRAIK
jgi:hypothetical protein